MTTAPLVRASDGLSLTPMPGRLFVLVSKPKEVSDGGVIYPHDAQPLSSEGEVFGVGPNVSLDIKFGDRVAILPSAGASLSISAPHLGFPSELLEVDQGDVLALADSTRWTTLFDPALPGRSCARRYHPIDGHVLIRPYSPTGLHAGGLITVKNEKWPRVWAWVLGVSVLDAMTLKPPGMVVYARFADEVLGYDLSKDGRRQLPVCIVSIKEIRAVMDDPVPVEPEYE